MRRLLGIVGLCAVLGATSVARADAAPRMIAEKATTLDESIRIAERLRAAGFDVVMTRTDDRFVSLARRAAASRGADLFLSIHNNGSHSRSVVGTEGYYQIGNRFGASLTSDIVQTISRRAGTLVRGAFTRRGENGDYYHVLRESRTTAIIVEGAFLSNPAEARRLATPEFRRQIADAVADVVVRRLVIKPAPQAAGPRPPKGTIQLPSPPTLATSVASRAVSLTWGGVKGANAYDVWRDGRFIARVGERHFVDRAPGVGRHRYEVRAALIAGILTVQESPSAVAEAVVPWRIVVDAGHGGSEPGAVGRY